MWRGGGGQLWEMNLRRPLALIQFPLGPGMQTPSQHLSSSVCMSWQGKPEYSVRGRRHQRIKVSLWKHPGHWNIQLIKNEHKHKTKSEFNFCHQTWKTWSRKIVRLGSKGNTTTQFVYLFVTLSLSLQNRLIISFILYNFVLFEQFFKLTTLL